MSTLPPLSHHEILREVGPFSRAGWVPDLAASDRAARRLTFRPALAALGHREGGEVPAGLVVQLSAEWSDDGKLRLVRTLEAPDGLQARLEVEAANGQEALERLATVPPARQFCRAGGGWLAWRHRLAPLSRGASPTLMLREAQGRVPGLGFEGKLSSVPGYPVEFELVRGSPGGPALPDDVLAVLGGGWDRLVPTARGWRGAASVRGAEPARTELAEARLVEAVDHLARTLSATPAEFHARHRAARWRVALRGTPPLLFGLALVVAAIAIQRWWPERAGWIGLLANMAPPVLMALFFMRREMPRIGLPRVPRRPPSSAWSPSAALAMTDPGPAAASSATAAAR